MMGRTFAPTEAYQAHNRAAAVEAMLRRLPGRLEDLDVTKSRRDKVAVSVGSSGKSEPPAPLRFEPMSVSDQIAARIRELMVVLDLDLGRTVVYREDVRDAAAELAAHSRWLSESEACDVAIDDLFQLEEKAVLLVDIPASDTRVFLGRCGAPSETGPCEADLYAEDHGHSHAQCYECGALVPVGARRARVFNAARDVTARPRVIEKMLKRQGVDVTADRIRQWASRKVKSTGKPRLEPAGEDEQGNAVYLVADVYALAIAAAERQRAG